MLLVEIMIAVVLVAAFIQFQRVKRQTNYKTALLANHIDSSEEMKRTLAMGLYLRFTSDEINEKGYSSMYIKQDPISFESFVARVIEKAKGGVTWVTPPIGDFGVDFEHDTKDGKFLGQVKCSKGDQPFNPIAIIHSNMIKHGAVGGYVITTGSFTSNAKEYAEGLNIELIDGVKLVEIWLDGIEDDEREIKQMLPEYI
ncbi:MULTISPECIES: restriction endonuclease [Cytobacillus]|uniref:restriction endonuclease n=1 Tax=Cytobacillus TaxID=2675230 RepID=UPI00203AA86F|nr:MULTISPECIES: restriction endonuclease [Cytobacillus]MCM3394869.1 restriction endonuclease [Cytobacillus oceanisediminis]UQX56049.1 restriction endonuclease [Cytobacillus pseudoceanisediminis]